MDKTKRKIGFLPDGKTYVKGTIKLLTNNRRIGADQGYPKRCYAFLQWTVNLQADKSKKISVA